MSFHSDPVINELLRWCSARGIQIDARIHLARGEDGSITVLSRDQLIQPRTTLVSIPKSVILSIRNCTLAGHIPQVIYGKEAQLGLALALYGELLNGNLSPWFGYLQSLPKRVSIPLFWDDTNEDEKVALEWIKGTMVEAELLNSISETAPGSSERSRTPVTDLRDYFQSTALPALSKANLGNRATIQGFKYAYALVSSRSFIVDIYHGLAMVPVADAFNHKLENQIHLESDCEVCRFCGSLAECTHDAEDEPECGRPSLLPANATGTIENTCEMVTNAPILPFTEVFNTYGEQLTNAQLLARYGFVLDVNENDTILWDAATLTSFVNPIAGHSGKAIRMHSHENSGPPVQRSGLGTDIPETKLFEGSTPHEQHSENAFSLDEVTQPQPVADRNDRVHEPSSFLLRRINDVLQLWDNHKPMQIHSNLIYFSDDTGQEKNSSILDAGKEIDVVENCTAPRLSRKHVRFHFALDDETRISHHLWIFCVLLALHAPQLRLDIQTDAARRSKSDALESFLSPTMNTEGGRISQEFRHRENWLLESKATSLNPTTAIEDVIILKQTFFAQKSLEVAHPTLETETASFSNEEIRRPSWVDSPAFSAMKDEEYDIHLVAKDQGGLEVPSSAKTSQQHELHNDRSRKRIRTSSADSSASHEGEGIRTRTRVCRDKMAGMKISSETGEAFAEACEDGDILEFTPSRDSLPVAVWHGQKRNNGLLSDLLRDYGDDSDIVGRSISDSEVELSSAAGGDGSRQENQYQGSVTQLADVDTRRHPGQVSEAGLSKGEKNIPDFRDRHDPSFASAAEDRRHNADVVNRITFDSAKTSPSRLISENALEKVDSEDASRDVSSLRLVAATARVVCALCAARSRNMAYPNKGILELGDMVDAIPASMVQARMAAQVALEERVRLEGCMAAWTEVEETALQLLHRP